MKNDPSESQKTQSDAIGNDPLRGQDVAKTELPQTGRDTSRYWRSRLFRNTYTARDGTKTKQAEWSVRIKWGGIRRTVRLTSANRERAAEEARDVFLKLQDGGWHAVGRFGVDENPAVEEFCALYENASRSMERMPRPISVRTYVRSLRQVCEYAGVTRIRELTPEAVERARDAYRAEARDEGRPESAMQNTISRILRNAAACFSEEARTILARRGLTLLNPFRGLRRTLDIQPVSPLPSETVERIWVEAHLLRDGDPAAADPNASAFAEKYRAENEGRKARWLPTDFRQPHPDSYAALLLALGAGLRANEIDKARWSWFAFDSKGEAFLEIREEADFKPKGGTLRRIKIPRSLSDAIAATRRDLVSPYVIGGDASPQKAAKGENYRRPETFRAVNAWLRGRGVEAEKARGHPLHRLRKQFGSEVATSAGLFAAQKLLGHSSPAVTSKYYAAQTELPELTHVRIVG